MSRNKVPPEGFLKRPEPGDDKFTIKQFTQESPSSILEEAVSSTILKFAKEKFDSRPWEDTEPESELEDDKDKADDGEEGMSPSHSSPVEMTSRSKSRSRSRSTSRPRIRSVKQESGSEDQRKRKTERMNIDINESDTEEEKNLLPPQERTLKPAVSADDELSYTLMRPAVRHILTKLDATLMVLHHSRDATMKNYLSDSSSDDDSGDPEATDYARRSRSKGSEPPAKKRRGRPAKAGLSLRIRKPPLPEQSENTVTSREKIEGTTTAPIQGNPPKFKVGRPKKVYPRLQGETDKEFAIRIAKLRKEPTPFFPDSEVDSDDPRSSTSEAHPRPRHITKHKPPKSREQSPDDPMSKKIRLEKNSARLGLRDWKDVLGAAALAGFPQAVLDRAARRCADLFGQNMELRTMTEEPLGIPGQEDLIQYHPGMIPNLATEVEQEDTDSEEDTRSQAKRRIRSCSVVSDDQRGRSKSRSRSGSRTRSRSVSNACSHFCGVRGCFRGTDGFSRRSNLLRHMKLVHNLDEADLPTDVDSEDEMVGAVHVDGFLKPIKIRKGWRGDDVRTDSSSKRRYGGRQRKRERSTSADGTGQAGDQDVDMADADS
jgi:hypothetical protein